MKRTRFIVFAFCVVFVFIITWIYRFVINDIRFVKKTHGHAQFSSNNPKIILIYTMHEKPWIKSTQTEIKQKLDSCIVKNCIGVYNKKMFKTADAVVFSGSFPFSKTILDDHEKPLYQRWIFFETETPRKKVLPDVFNITMTYKASSDVYLPYGQYEKYGSLGVTNETDYFKGKSKFALWLVSNCAPRVRKNVAFQLAKHIDLDIGGKCSKKFKGAREIVNCPNKTCIKDYKFYLAFENEFCDEYISDKYWLNAISMGTIPIVLGGANYSNTAIPGSYIQVEDFNTIKDLSIYLRSVGSNKTSYNSYFKWKNHYRYKQTSSQGWPHTSTWICELCNILHNDTYPRKVYKMSEFWNKTTDCQFRDQPMKGILFRGLFPKRYP